MSCGRCPLTTLFLRQVNLDDLGHVLAGFALVGAEGGGIAVEQPQQVALEDGTADSSGPHASRLPVTGGRASTRPVSVAITALG